MKPLAVPPATPWPFRSHRTMAQVIADKHRRLMLLRELIHILQRQLRELERE